MKQLVKPMGRGYQTNCYLLIHNDKSLIIDPGIGATEWVIENAVNPVAILNTHGHFDHVWSNAALQEALGVPVYIHALDAPMLQMDPFNLQMPLSRADVLIADENPIALEGFEFRFVHMPGHTPGTAMIVFEDRLFTGDFLFDGTIGRTDFLGSDPKAMIRSLERFMTEFEGDRPLYPGHGIPTSEARARRFIPDYITMLQRAL